MSQTEAATAYLSKGLFQSFSVEEAGNQPEDNLDPIPRTIPVLTRWRKQPGQRIVPPGPPQGLAIVLIRFPQEIGISHTGNDKTDNMANPGWIPDELSLRTCVMMPFQVWPVYRPCLDELS